MIFTVISVLFTLGTFTLYGRSKKRAHDLNNEYNDLLSQGRAHKESSLDVERKMREIKVINSTVVSKTQLDSWANERFEISKEMAKIDAEIKALMPAYRAKQAIEEEKARKKREEEAARRRRQDALVAAAASSYSSSRRSSSSSSFGGRSSWGGGGGGFSGGGASGGW